MTIEVYTAIPGDPRQEHHEVTIFVGDWRAFAKCGCGWHTNSIRRYYSPILDATERSIIEQRLSNAGTDHKLRMDRYWLRMMRAWARWRQALKEAYGETVVKYKLGEKQHEHHW